KKDDDDLTPKEKGNYSLEEIKNNWIAANSNNQCFFISAKRKQNIEDLRERLYEYVKKVHVTRFPYNDFLY
ncbi:MAG: GTPase HflX, partial [Bacteroidetes bacterium]